MWLVQCLELALLLLLRCATTTMYCCYYYYNYYYCCCCYYVLHFFVPVMLQVGYPRKSWVVIIAVTKPLRTTPVKIFFIRALHGSRSGPDRGRFFLTNSRIYSGPAVRRCSKSLTASGLRRVRRVSKLTGRVGLPFSFFFLFRSSLL